MGVEFDHASFCVSSEITLEVVFPKVKLSDMNSCLRPSLSPKILRFNLSQEEKDKIIKGLLGHVGKPYDAKRGLALTWGIFSNRLRMKKGPEDLRNYKIEQWKLSENLRKMKGKLLGKKILCTDLIGFYFQEHSRSFNDLLISNLDILDFTKHGSLSADDFYRLATKGSDYGTVKIIERPIPQKPISKELLSSENPRGATSDENKTIESLKNVPPSILGILTRNQAEGDSFLTELKDLLISITMDLVPLALAIISEHFQSPFFSKLFKIVHLLSLSLRLQGVMTQNQTNISHKDARIKQRSKTVSLMIEIMYLIRMIKYPVPNSSINPKL